VHTANPTEKGAMTSPVSNETKQGDSVELSRFFSDCSPKNLKETLSSYLVFLAIVHQKT
jgi:hypothetical protein